MIRVKEESEKAGLKINIQYRASNLDWRLISYMILYMFLCHSPKSSHPLPLPQSPKDCSIHQCPFCCLVNRVIVTISMHDTGCLGLVHWDDPEGWYGEGGGRRLQDGEHTHTKKENQHSKDQDHGIQSHHFMEKRWRKSENSNRLYFLGLQSHWGW